MTLKCQRFVAHCREYKTGQKSCDNNCTSKMILQHWIFSPRTKHRSTQGKTNKQMKTSRKKRKFKHTCLFKTEWSLPKLSRIEAIHGNNMLGLLQGVRDRGMIMQSKITAEPNYYSSRRSRCGSCSRVFRSAGARLWQPHQFRSWFGGRRHARRTRYDQGGNGMETWLGRQCMGGRSWRRRRRSGRCHRNKSRIAHVAISHVRQQSQRRSIGLELAQTKVHTFAVNIWVPKLGNCSWFRAHTSCNSSATKSSSERTCSCTDATVSKACMKTIL